MGEQKTVVLEFGYGGLLVTLPIERAVECVRGRWSWRSPAGQRPALLHARASNSVYTSDLLGWASGLLAQIPRPPDERNRSMFGCTVARPEALHEGGHEMATMILATTQVEDFDRFLTIFSTRGAEKRKQHGSKGSTVFRDPNEPDRVWALFDWDAQGWQNFVSDPDVPAILQEAGHKGKPQAAEVGGRYDA
jgi:hypothetical protein